MWSTGTVQSRLLPGRSPFRKHHQLPRVLHGAGLEQPGHRVHPTSQRNHCRFRRFTWRRTF